MVRCEQEGSFLKLFSQDSLFIFFFLKTSTAFEPTQVFKLLSVRYLPCRGEAVYM